MKKSEQKITIFLTAWLAAAGPFCHAADSATSTTSNPNLVEQIWDEYYYANNKSVFHKKLNLKDAFAQILEDADAKVAVIDQTLRGIEYKCNPEGEVQEIRPKQANEKHELSLGVNQQLSQRFERVGYEQANFKPEVNKYVADQAQAWSGLSLSQVQRKIRSDESQGLTEYNSQEVFDSYLRHRLIETPTGQRAAFLSEAGQHLSFEQQLAFVAKVGGNALASYDLKRTNLENDNIDFVTCSEIISNLNESKKLGISRDISRCQARILEQMGNKDNVYMVSYAAMESYNSAVVASDPRNPRIVHKISYGNQAVETTLRGSQALSQDHEHPDVGIVYRVYKPSGELVASLPSEMGLVLNKMTGGDNQRDFDPFVREQFNINSTNVKYKSINGNLYRGKLANGDDITGAAVSTSWDQKLLGSEENGELAHHGRAGLAATYRKVDTTKNYDPQNRRTFRTVQVYVVGEDEVVVTKKIDENTKLQPYMRAKLANSGAISVEDPINLAERKQTSDTDLTVDYGIRSETTLGSEDKTTLRADLHQQKTVGINSIDAVAENKIAVVTNNTVVSAAVEHKSTDELKLMGQATYAQREYGDSAGVDAGVRLQDGDNETIIVAGYYTPVGKKAQGWQPGGGDAGFSAKIMRQLRGDSDVNAGVTIFRSQSGLWFVNSELGIRWE